MGDTEKGADHVDDQIWGSDEEQEEADGNSNVIILYLADVNTLLITDDNMNEEKGNSGEKEGDQKMAAKENQSAENEDNPDSQNESENKKSTNQLNEEDPEYDDDQVDPYHGNQPELPEPEPMDLPDNLELDDSEKEANEANEDENPFDIDAMKGKLSLFNLSFIHLELSTNRANAS